MSKDEAIKRLEHCIEQLKAWGYPWAIRRAADMEDVMEFIRREINDN